MLKVGLVGIGGMGFVHFNAYKNMDDCKIVAVADVRTDMAKEKAADESINIYPSIDEMIANEELDIIDICTPSYLHADISIKALESGANVICEKPMTLNSADAERVIEAAKKSDKKFMIAHVVRFMTPYAYLADEIKKGELGELLRLDMKRISSIPLWSWENWMRDYSKSGGTPMDLTIHDIDYVQSILGQPDEVRGRYYKMNDNNDYVLSELVYGNTVVTAEGTWFNCDIPFDASYRAVFSNGWIALKDGKVYKNGEVVELEQGETSEDTGINLSGADGYATEIRYFVECVKTNIQPSFVTPESSKASVELIERIIKNSSVM